MLFHFDMHRAGQMIEAIAAPDNLRLAFLKAAKGKRAHGCVQAFAARMHEEIPALHAEILSGAPRVGQYTFFTIKDPKERLICAAAFRERVLHHAVMNVCEPFFEAYQIHDSYACRAGKGLHAALARAGGFARRFPWHVKMDIRKYFDSIDHETLRGLLARRFKDKKVLAIFNRILSSYQTAPGKGVPIGNLLSQHWANFYLGLFDHWVKETARIIGYVRYMDDFILWHDNRQALKECCAQATAFLRERLRLAVKNNIQLNRGSYGLPFLGFRVYAHTLRLAPRSKRRFVEKLRQYESNHLQGIWSEGELQRHMLPLLEFVKTADSGALRARVITQYGCLS